MFAILQDEPQGKNIALFTAKIITKYIVFFGMFSLYLRSENVKTSKNLYAYQEIKPDAIVGQKTVLCIVKLGAESTLDFRKKEKKKKHEIQ